MWYAGPSRTLTKVQVEVWAAGAILAASAALGCSGRSDTRRTAAAGADGTSPGAAGSPNGGSAGAVESPECAEGDVADCRCPGGGFGQQVCTPQGSFEPCRCDLVAPLDAGLPSSCGGGTDCGSCGTCLSECVCYTSNHEQCVEICAECSGARVDDAPSCESCPFSLPWAHACFTTIEEACACACGAPGAATCKIGGNTCVAVVECTT